MSCPFWRPFFLISGNVSAHVNSFNQASSGCSSAKPHQNLHAPCCWSVRRCLPYKKPSPKATVLWTSSAALVGQNLNVSASSHPRSSSFFRNTPSTAGNSMTGSERPSPEPLLKKRRSQPYWGGENSGNALEASNALNCRVWAILAVLSKGIPGNALRAFPGSFRNFSGISSGKSQPYWGCGPLLADSKSESFNYFVVFTLPQKESGKRSLAKKWRKKRQKKWPKGGRKWKRVIELILPTSFCCTLMSGTIRLPPDQKI